MGQGALRVRSRSTAAGDAVMGESPGGQLRAFLDTTESHVDTVGIDVNRHRAQRGHAVDNCDCTHRVRRAGDRGQVLQRPGGCFGMYEGNGVGLFAIQELSGFRLSESLAPRLARAHYICAVAAAHFDKALGEVSGSEDSKLLAGLHEIRQRGFHACAAGSRDHLDKGILRAENRTEVAADVFRNFEEIRIQMADNRLPHGLIDTGMNLRGAGQKS